MNNNTFIQIACLLVISFSSWGQNTPPNTTTDTSNQQTVPVRIHGSVERPMIPANKDVRSQYLKNELHHKKAHELTASTGKFLALWEADRSGAGKGAVLIVHADGEHLTSPQTNYPLHKTLPDYGWATIAINLPSSEAKPIPKRTFPVKSKIISEQPANKDAPAAETMEDRTQAKESANTDQHPTELIAHERLTAAIAFLHSKGQFNIIFFGHGIGALRAHRFLKAVTPVITDPQLKKEVEKPISAFIGYNARNTLSNDKEGYKHWFFDPEIPFLDIYSNKDPRNSIAVEERRIQAKRQKVQLYQKVNIRDMNNEYAQGENRLSRRIRSFIEANAQGVQVGNAKVR